MSKTQDKRALRKAEQQEFIRARRIQQLYLFEQALEAGVRVYEINKEKLSEAEIEAIEKQLEENRALVDKLKSEIDSPTQA
jgi:hypothetical protein